MPVEGSEKLNPAREGGNSEGERGLRHARAAGLCSSCPSGGRRRCGCRQGSEREREPVGKVRSSHLTASSALLPHTSPKTLLTLF